MNNTVIKASVDAGMSLLEVSTKLGPNDTIVDLAQLIKCDSARVKEFINTFTHRKKISPKVRWESLIVLNSKEAAFKLVTIDKEGEFDYADTTFLAYVIDRYVALTGILQTHNVISNAIAASMTNSRYNSYVQAIKVMVKFVKEYEPFLYSEFASDFYSPEVLLEAISIVETYKETE